MRQDKPRQRKVTDAGTKVRITKFQCRYSDKHIYFIRLNTPVDLRFRLCWLSNQTL